MITNRGIKKHVNDLQDLMKIMKSSGSYDYSEYFFGMANGMELCLALIEQREPDYLNKPDKWLCDNPSKSPPLEQQECF